MSFLTKSIDGFPGFPAILGYCSEFDFVFTMRDPIRINHKAILHKNCHSSPTIRIVCLHPNYVYMMPMPVCSVSWNRMLSCSLLHMITNALQVLT